MNIKTFNSQYNLVEFHHYINQVDNKTVNIVELLLNCPVDEFLKVTSNQFLLLKKKNKLMYFHGTKLMSFMKKMDC